ncbi:MAG: UDP-N-acetylglucosamine 1-carboxyvinyltransferase [Bacillota bacterium]|nr:UDP-N-acetylglucosamine 1-carboxyvinyltransferase [Bacillota bacterium]
MERILVEGGVPLMGRIRIKGAKNACLPMMAASLLTSEDIILDDVPDLDDVRTMSRLLRSLGVEVYRDRKNERIYFNSRGLNNCTAPYGPVRRMRASFLIMGPLLARMGRSRISLPGGCAIGTRPIDLHLKGLAAMGSQFTMDDGYIEAETPFLRGNRIYLDYPSVGATENIMMAAVLARGTTVIENAAAEPEIIDLASFLKYIGARIEGAGTPLIEIEGVNSLTGGHYRVIPDRIEAGTFMVAAAISGGDIILENVIPQHLTAVISKLQETGVLVEELGQSLIRIRSRGRVNAVDIKTLPYPGFPTDLQPQFMALLSLAHGTSVISETVFEKRYMHVEEMIRMGARVRIEERTAIITGQQLLQGAIVRAPDLRGGAALVLSALAARGFSEIRGINHIRRGYNRLAGRLRSLGGRVFVLP